MTLCCFLPHAVSSQIVDTQAIANPKGEWLNHGRDYQEQRFSPLAQINTDNIKELSLAWSFEFPTKRAMEATPLVHNGVLYVTTGWSQVYAFNAKTGAKIWSFDPKVDKSHLIKTCCGPVNRGVALSGGGDIPLQVYVGVLDGRLIALDALTGKQNWSVQTTPSTGNYSITGAPRVVKDLVIIGNGGADLGARGYVTAYDTVSGKRRWRFYTVPGDRNSPQESDALEKALNTWTGDYWYQQGGGGGTVWDSMAYDPNLDLIYIGTGNGSPWNRNIRSPQGGDNLYLSSIVALDADSGEYVWHYQVTPKENWDYTATQHLILAELEIDGERRSVIMQAPKNGFFYVLDRKTGELLSADAYTHVTWAEKIDLATGRPVETKYADYQSNGGSTIWPAPIGAHNWQPMSYSQKSGLVYIPVQNIPGYYSALHKVSYTEGRWNTGTDMYEVRSPKDWVVDKAIIDALVYGELVAWDPIKKQRVWQVRHQQASNGGVLSTEGGLVFQGDKLGKFAAFDAKKGTRLWEFQSDSAILAGPISYELDGEQYVAVAQGGGGAVMLLGVDGYKKSTRVNRNRLLVFKLGGTAQDQFKSDHNLAEVPPLEHKINGDSQLVEQGAKLYERNCATCHGISAKSNGVVPDLRYMSTSTHEQFTGIVFGGALAKQGMVGFHPTMELADVNAIHAYLDYEQQELSKREEMSVWQKMKYWLVYAVAKIGERFPDIANKTREWNL